MAVFAACCCSREANDRQAQHNSTIEFCWLGIAADLEIRYDRKEKKQNKR
jgi:hypothetical protein